MYTRSESTTFFSVKYPVGLEPWQFNNSSHTAPFLQTIEKIVHLQCVRLVIESVNSVSRCQVFSQMQFPNGDFPSDSFPSGNLPNVQLPKVQLSKGQVIPFKLPRAALGSRVLRLGWASAAAMTELRNCRLPGNCTSEAPTQKINLGKLPLREKPLGKYITSFSTLNAGMHRDVGFLLILVTAERTILSYFLYLILAKN